MNEFWRQALTVAGIGAIGAFVFWSLYKQWLKLPIFQQLTKKQLYNLSVLFLVLTFLALIATLGAWLIKGKLQDSQQEYSFWSRTKTSAGPHRLIRHSFSTEDECITEEKKFKPYRLLLIGYGCNDPDPDIPRLQLDCNLNNKSDACAMLIELGHVPVPHDGKKDGGSSAGIDDGDWRFWSINNGMLNDERFSDNIECLRVQAGWDEKTYGNIIFPCAKVERQLLRRATEECSNDKEFSCEWKLRIERALSEY